MVGDIGIGAIIQAVVEAGNIDVIDREVAQRPFRRMETDTIGVVVFGRGFILAFVNFGANAFDGEIFKIGAGRIGTLLSSAAAGIATQEIVMVAFVPLGMMALMTPLPSR